MHYDKETFETFKKTLEENGYTKYTRDFKRSDYGMWKSFHVTYDKDGDKNIGYQIACLVYDFSKYPQHIGDKPIGVQYEFVLGNNPYVGRCDMTISDDRVTIEEFEVLSEEFYQRICKEQIFENREAGTPIEKIKECDCISSVGWEKKENGKIICRSCKGPYVKHS